MRRLPIAIGYLDFLAKEVEEKNFESNPIRIDAILHSLNMVGEALKKSKVTILAFPDVSAPGQLSDLRDEFVHKTPKKIFLEEKPNQVTSYTLFIKEIKTKPQFSQLSKALKEISEGKPYTDKNNIMQRYFTRLRSRYQVIVTNISVNNLADYFEYNEKLFKRFEAIINDLNGDIKNIQTQPSHLYAFLHCVERFYEVNQFSLLDKLAVEIKNDHATKNLILGLQTTRNQIMHEFKQDFDFVLNFGIKLAVIKEAMTTLKKKELSTPQSLLAGGITTPSSPPTLTTSEPLASPSTSSSSSSSSSSSLSTVVPSVPLHEEKKDTVPKSKLSAKAKAFTPEPKKESTTSSETVPRLSNLPPGNIVVVPRRSVTNDNSTLSSTQNLSQNSSQNSSS